MHVGEHAFMSNILRSKYVCPLDFPSQNLHLKMINQLTLDSFLIIKINTWIKCE